MKRFIPAVEKARELLPKIGPGVSSYFRSYQKWGPVWGPQPSLDAHRLQIGVVFRLDLPAVPTP